MPEEAIDGVPMGVYIRKFDCMYYADRERFNTLWWDERVRNKEEESGFEVFHSHTPYSLYPGWLIHDAYTVAWLRHPVALQLSWYLWDTSHRHLIDFDGPHDFVRQCSRRNIMSRMVEDEKGQHRIDFFGITEHWGQSLQLLAARLEWPPVAPLHINGPPALHTQTRLRNLMSDRQLLKDIVLLYKDDMALYDYYRNTVWLES